MENLPSQVASSLALQVLEVQVWEGQLLKVQLVLNAEMSPQCHPPLPSCCLPSHLSPPFPLPVSPRQVLFPGLGHGEVEAEGLALHRSCLLSLLLPAGDQVYFLSLQFSCQFLKLKMRKKEQPPGIPSQQENCYFEWCCI